MGNSNRNCPFLKQTEIQIGGCEVDMMFEDLDKFIAENPEEVLVTGGWTDDKISELEKQLSIAFREEVKNIYTEIWRSDWIWCGDCGVWSQWTFSIG